MAPFDIPDQMPTVNTTPSSQRVWRAAVLVLVPVAFGFYAVSRGRDANWDLQNYHWYDAYALLDGRYDRDVAPAHTMSFLPPHLYVLWFLLGNALPARALAFIIGAVHSANLLLLYGLGLVTLPIERRLPREALALILATVGMCGGMSLGLLGTTFIDSVVTIGILASLLATIVSLPILTAGTAARAAWRAALAAVPAALAVSGKPTVATFALGIAVGLLLVEAPLPRRLWLFLWFGIGGTLTTAVCLGPWLAHVWAATGSPFYPDFARFFHSPFAGDGWNLDRWSLHGAREAFYYPFVFATDSARVAEVPFTDWRIAAAYVLVPAGLGIRLLRRASGCPPLAPGFAIVVATMAVGYVLWLAVFTYYRYAVTLELLAPLAIALVAMGLPLSWPMRSLLVGVIMLGLVATTRPADWGHLPWTTRLVEVSAPPIADPATATVLLSGQPIGYVVPSLPSPAAVIDLDMASWYGGNRAAWARLIGERLAMRSGPVYAVFFAGKETNMTAAAAPFGLRLDAARCRPMPTNLPSAGLPSVNALVLCPMERVAVPQR
jgi:hypothetical protein